MSYKIQKEDVRNLSVGEATKREMMMSLPRDLHPLLQKFKRRKVAMTLRRPKDGSKKGQGDRHLDTVEKLKKRSERFKLPMPTEKANKAGVKKIECETLPSEKIEGPADSEVKAERPSRKRRWTSS